MKRMNFSLTIGLLIIAVFFDVGLLCPNSCSCKLPSYRSTTYEIDCKNIGLTNFPVNYSYPTRATSINLENNQITTIEQEAFRDSSELRYLYLGNNSITIIKQEPFWYIPELRVLNLQNNQIETIEQGSFQNKTKLYHIDLMNNQISSIQLGLFKDLTALKNLNLTNNQITVIQQGAFEDLPMLENLHLEYNSISVIEDNAFINMPETLSLYLDGNAIAGIDGSVFQGQVKFNAISVQYNTFQTVRRDTFSGYQLKKISLQYCSIEMLEAGAFSEVTDINIIHLEDNNITEIVIGVFVFQHQPFLSELRLSRNRLSFLEEKTFNNLPNIVNLYLDANEIVYIEIDAFYNLERLQLLDLKNNKIAVIERLTLYGIRNCIKLNFTGNNLTFVNRDIFDDIDDLEILYWSDNRITTIEQGTFRSLPSLYEIHLNNNQLTTIQQGVFQELQNLRKLYLNNNQIATLQQGAFRGLPRLNELYLSNNQLTTIQQGVFNELTSLLKLDIQHNNISVIESDAFINLTRLKRLNFSGNQLHEFVMKDLFEKDLSLSHLDLSGNNLTVVQKDDTFVKFQYISYLFIDFVCDCNVPFWSWLNSKRYITKRVTCLDTNNVPVSRRYFSDFDNCTYSSNHCAENMDNYNTIWNKAAENTLSILPCSAEDTSNISRYCKSDGQWEEPNYSNCIESANLCTENLDKLHTNWTITAESTLVTLGCSGDYTGNVSRYCSSDGQWEEPNYSNCVRKSIQHVKEKTARLLNGGASDYNIVTIILKELENITRDNIELRSGDLLTTSSILNDIAKYVTDHREKLSVVQLEIFASLCNNLIDERNRQPWEELIDEGSGGAAPLVNAVTEFNDAFNDVIDSNFSLVAEKENVVMEVGKTSSDEIIVPDRSKTNVTWLSDSGTEIKLTLQKNICTGLTGYSSTFYRNVSGLFPEYLLLNGTVKSFNGSYDVNSIIADFTIHGSSCSNYTLTMKFDHLLGNYIRPFCGHWDFNAPNTSNGAWSSFGSRIVDAEDSHTICEYNHTTNFAILMSPEGRSLSRAHHLPLSLISTIGCGVSILFLVITIIIHVVFWRDVSDDGTKVLMNLCVALIISYVIFLAGITQTENKVVCSAIAVAMHYIFLTDFALMLAEGILFVKMVVFIFNKRSIVNQLIPPCWVVPAVIVGISAGVTKLRGYGNHKYCWLSPETNLIWAFIGPALLVITINVIVIIITVYKMMTVKAVAAKTPKEKSKIGLKGIRVMLPLFGVTWVLGTFSLNDDLVMFQYLFAICNSLQGLFIFVFNCCLTDKIRKGYREYKRRRANQMDSKLSTECTNNDNLKTAHRRQNVYTEEMDNTL